MEDIVTITCYNKTEKMPRAKARKFYMEAIDGCDIDSSEADRYMSIVGGLDEGKTEVDDQWNWL